ncbi:CoA transferase [Tsukamurella paurometabola]
MRASTPQRPRRCSRGPRYAVHRTKGDGAVAFAGVEPRQWQRFCTATGATDPGGLPELFASKTLAEWLELGRTHRLALAPAYRDAGEARTDPALTERGAFVDETSPLYGDFTYLAPPARVNGQDYRLSGPAPAAGADTDTVRAELAMRKGV